MTSILKSCRGCMLELSLKDGRADKRLTEKFTYCTNIECSPEDGLPDKFCKLCDSTIALCYRFIQEARRVDVVMREFISTIRDDIDPSEVKIESRISSLMKFEDSEVKQEYEAGDDILEIKFDKVVEGSTDYESKDAEEQDYEEDYSLNSANDDDSDFDYVPEKEEKRVRRKSKLNSERVKDVLSKRNKSAEKNSNQEQIKEDLNEEQEYVDESYIDEFSKNEDCDYKPPKRENDIRPASDYERNVKNILAKSTNRKRKSCEETPLQCEYCNKPFSTKFWYRKHLKTVHKDNTDSKFTCKICSRGFSRSDVLKQHMVVHSDERPFACDVCPKRFKMRKLLNQHVRMHKLQAEFMCHICNASFKIRSTLNTHMKTHLAKNSNLCHLCGAGFTMTGNLRQHMRTHTGERPYACTRCNFRSSMSSSLRRHERIHTGFRPHACPHCNKTFLDLGGLKRHVRTHTGELPYQCHLCSRAFIDSSKRKRHILSQHQVAGGSSAPTIASVSLHKHKHSAL